jgi:hypothetical protein
MSVLLPTHIVLVILSDGQTPWFDFGGVESHHPMSINDLNNIPPVDQFPKSADSSAALCVIRRLLNGEKVCNGPTGVPNKYLNLLGELEDDHWGDKAFSWASKAFHPDKWDTKWEPCVKYFFVRCQNARDILKDPKHADHALISANDYGLVLRRELTRRAR